MAASDLLSRCICIAAPAVSPVNAHLLTGPPPPVLQKLNKRVSFVREVIREVQRPTLSPFIPVGAWHDFTARPLAAISEDARVRLSVKPSIVIP